MYIHKQSHAHASGRRCFQGGKSCLHHSVNKFPLTLAEQSFSSSLCMWWALVQVLRQAYCEHFTLCSTGAWQLAPPGSALKYSRGSRVCPQAKPHSASPCWHSFLPHIQAGAALAATHGALPTSKDWQGPLVTLVLAWGLFLWAFFSPRCLSFNVCLD